MKKIRSKWKTLRVVTTLYTNFSDIQGQATPWSVVGFNLNSNSSKILCMSSSPARIKKIHSKMKTLEWSHFPSITLWELSVAMETIFLKRYGPKPNAAFPPPQLLQIKFDCWSQRYSCLCKHRRQLVDSHTPLRLR